MHKLNIQITSFLLFLSIAFYSPAQSIPSAKVLPIHELSYYLKPDILTKTGFADKVDETTLAAHFRQTFAQGFFYNYNTFNTRLAHYNELYNNHEDHKARALDHLNKYDDAPPWVLPFNYKNGTPVNAYALRHLARQHKMVDIAFYYFNEGRDPKYIKYFENQMQSLNAALESGEYEKIEDGNGVYEVFRSGYRILNWLWIHNMFLNEEEYSDEDQLQTIATLLQHAQHLYERNGSFRSGNHQTRGMSALAMLSILFNDFKGSDEWFDRAMQRLSEHLDKEINEDGFQFERSVHYHMSDINNYFYVYQLAKLNSLEIDPSWENKLRTLFTTLVKIAYPDGSAPVLQDDTEIPWAEKNDISGVMTLGYLLFEDPEFGYFASDKVDDRMYWFLSKKQIDLLRNIEKKKPTYGSLSFDKTHYYIMREGWDDQDKMMIISAGLDPEKPDHQHGDMLGIQAMANQRIILPNYQVRYSLKDYGFFKNSMVKNVALVDDELQGKKYTSNKGGSGFGKFKLLPQPETVVWENNDAFDLFIGRHDGFENIGVEYSRQVIYIKDDLWVIKDNFKAEGVHDYKQVWQGHYTQEVNPNIIRSTFDDASGCDILQLHSIDTLIQSGSRGKTWTVVSNHSSGPHSFVTVIFPYVKYHNRIDETETQLNIGDWVVNNSKWTIDGPRPSSITKNDENYFFDITSLHHEDVFIKLSKAADLYLQTNKNETTFYLLSEHAITLNVEQKDVNGDSFQKLVMKPGQKLSIAHNR